MPNQSKNRTTKIKKPAKALRTIALSREQAERVLSTTGLSREQAERVTAKIVDDALARSKTKPEPPSETEAAIAIVRTWLGKAGFHEDPAGTDPARIEIQSPGWEGRTHEHYVDVRVYIPALDIEHVVDGTHPDGITTEAP